MKKRTDFSRESKKSPSYTVRFPRVFLEKIMADRGLKKGQAIVDFLADFYLQQFHPIVGNPVMERNPFVGVHPKLGQEATGAKKPAVVVSDLNKTAEGNRTIDTTQPIPPAGLTGLELSIWKRENLKK